MKRLDEIPEDQFDPSFGMIVAANPAAAAQHFVQQGIEPPGADWVDRTHKRARAMTPFDTSTPASTSNMAPVPNPGGGAALRGEVESLATPFDPSIPQGGRGAQLATAAAPFGGAAPPPAPTGGSPAGMPIQQPPANATDQGIPKVIPDPAGGGNPPTNAGAALRPPAQAASPPEAAPATGPVPMPPLRPDVAGRSQGAEPEPEGDSNRVPDDGRTREPANTDQANNEGEAPVADTNGPQRNTPGGGKGLSNILAGVKTLQPPQPQHVYTPSAHMLPGHLPQVQAPHVQAPAPHVAGAGGQSGLSQHVLGLADQSIKRGMALKTLGEVLRGKQYA